MHACVHEFVDTKPQQRTKTLTDCNGNCYHFGKKKKTAGSRGRAPSALVVAEPVHYHRIPDLAVAREVNVLYFDTCWCGQSKIATHVLSCPIVKCCGLLGNSSGLVSNGLCLWEILFCCEMALCQFLMMTF